MKTLKPILTLVFVLTNILVFTSCDLDRMAELNENIVAENNNDPNINPFDPDGAAFRKGDESSVTHNLSFPVIWAEGTPKTLRTLPGDYEPGYVKLDGEYWYVWDEDPADPSYPVLSCLPVDGEDLCYPDDREDVYKAWVQKDANNFWQADAENAIGIVEVDVLDWGDNLESVDWYLTSKVRTEVVLYDNHEGATPLRQYLMRHVSGWGSDELHGLQTDLDNNPLMGPGDQATIYSEHARFTIQKITSETPELTWNAETSAWEGDALPPVFSGAVWEAGDGPGYYNAEINIKGKIIYGYTWDVKRANDGMGVYRLTFSFDDNDNSDVTTALNTFFTGSTVLAGSEPEEPGEISASEEGGGAAPVIDHVQNITYIDINILGNKGGGKGGKGTDVGTPGKGGNGGNGGKPSN
ncbi:hypothetical protein E4S40_03290 [Algoriphagus kandeliae]|uniref:Uncharacterized protein n=1 Tax=Algoriphagus kandeliae TaxID=2562278 RepID=A0A4Y9R180_9BACT|nr:hypothetical protein [Algoriphagus kandeliae]TFV97682.1 hypothetical protein E4S40_03290 [Algoriphagus kandeliae]